MRFHGLWVSGEPAAAAGGIASKSRKGGRAGPGQPTSLKVSREPEGEQPGGEPAGGTGARLEERRDQGRPSSALLTAALVIVAASAAILYATMLSDGEHPAPEPEPVAATSPAPNPQLRKTDPVAAARFARPAAPSCDGRMRCSQMNSCAEAKFYLANCPAAAAEMDSNLNGIPCDTQWCTAGAATKGAP